MVPTSQLAHGLTQSNVFASGPILWRSTCRYKGMRWKIAPDCKFKWTATIFGNSKSVRDTAFCVVLTGSKLTGTVNYRACYAEAVLVRICDNFFSHDMPNDTFFKLSQGIRPCEKDAMKNECSLLNGTLWRDKWYKLLFEQSLVKLRYCFVYWGWKSTRWKMERACVRLW